MKLIRLAALTFGIAACGGADEPGRASFRVEEATIAQIHEAMEAGDLRARDLVEAYLARIEKYDRRGPALNALVTVNRNALTEPYRVCRRAFSLRGWSHVTTESVFPRSTRASGAAGPRARG